MLMAFPITLKGKARLWINRLSAGSITTWDLLKNAFLSRYHPLSQIIRQTRAIRNFRQECNEPLHLAWERFEDLLYNCPEHKINKHEQLQIFYQGLDPETRKKADFMGPIPRMTPATGIKAINELSKHSLSWYKEEEYKENDFDKVLKYINSFEHNISVLNEEVRMVQHQYKTLNNERDSLLEETASAIKSIEKNLGRIAESMHERGVCTLLSFTETNPRGLAHAITTCIVLNKVLPKENDPRGFTIPYVIGQSGITKALADLGASTSLMTYSMFLRLNLDCNNPALFATNSIDKEKPTPKLKELPSHLEYTFLDNNRELPVIISLLLSDQEKGLLLEVLTKHKKDMAWKISDIKGVSPSFCTHMILMEENSKPTVQPQCRLNPKVQDVVKPKILKLLDAGLIYAISDGP
ncbi:putative reverse transcriptase domain-containing protein [Tanacetum coccineum]